MESFFLTRSYRVRFIMEKQLDNGDWTQVCVELEGVKKKMANYFFFCRKKFAAFLTQTVPFPTVDTKIFSPSGRLEGSQHISRRIRWPAQQQMQNCEEKKREKNRFKTKLLTFLKHSLRRKIALYFKNCERFRNAHCWQSCGTSKTRAGGALACHSSNSMRRD